MNAPDHENDNSTSALRRINLLVSLAGLSMLVLILYGYYNGVRLHDLNSPLISAVKEIRLDASAARLGIYEISESGADAVTEDVWDYLDKSIWYFENLLTSGIEPLQDVIPVRNKGIRDQIDGLKSRFAELKDLTAQQAGVLWKMDEISAGLVVYDQKFAAFFQQLDRLEGDLIREMRKDQALFRFSHAFLALFCIILMITVGLTIRRYERRRSEYVRTLKNTNAQLEKEISEREEIERALKESENLFRTVFETIPDSIIVSRLQDNTIVDVNNGFLELTGFSKNDVIGQTALDLTLWEEPEKRDRFISILESRRTIHNFESRFRMKDGHVRTALLSVNAIDLKGESHFITVARNVSELKEAEMALRDSEERFRGLFESAADKIYLLDLEGRILISNPAANALLGYSEAEMRGCRLTEFVEPASRDYFDHVVSGLPTVGQMMCEVNMVSKGGRRITVDCSASAIRDEKGSVDCIVAFQKDITERKFAEQKRQATHDFLIIANRQTDMQPMLQDFVAATKKLTGCQAAAIRILDEDGNIPYAFEDGFGAKFCEVENFLSVNNDQGMCTQVVRNDIDPALPNFTALGSYFINDFPPVVDGHQEGPEHCLRNTCNRFGFRSIALIPIRLGKHTLGLLHVADRRENMFAPESVEMLEAAAMQLGATIRRLRAEEALKAAYQVLEDRVMERTIELSMANDNLKAEIEVRLQAEERLRENRNMLQTLIDGIMDALILVDQDMRIRMLNRGAAELYGIPSFEAVIGEQCFNATGSVGACTNCDVPQAVAKGQTLIFERPGLRDAKRLEQVSVYPIQEQESETGGAIVRISDITEERRFERQLIQSEKMASLGILVSSIAHEINNPNSFVTFNIPILREYLEELIGIADGYAEKQPEFELFHMTYAEFRKDVFKLVDNIEHGASRISTFVSNLREFSQSNGDRQKVMLELPVVLDKVLSICRSQIKKRVKTFETDLPADLPPVFADEYSLEQVLLNLIVNAVQAADKQDSFVILRASSGRSWRDHTIIEVIDNGCGIDQKKIERIFDPFYTTKSANEGTGLGLYVCHNLIESLGGRIEVESRPGEGSTFSVYLPDRDRRKKPRPASAAIETLPT